MKINKNAVSLTEIGGLARQGDTLLRRIGKTPTGLKKIKSPTLALGEVSGHHHTFRDGGAVAFADDAEAITADFVTIREENSVLTHEEHEPITFPKGDYESLKQMEYTPQALQRVAD